MPADGVTRSYPNSVYATSMTYCQIEIFHGSITKEYAENQIANVWQNVVTHELGHAMGLDDLDKDNSSSPTVSHSVMSYGRDRTSLAVPHNCDVAGVKKLYMNGGN